MYVPIHTYKSKGTMQMVFMGRQNGNVTHMNIKEQHSCHYILMNFQCDFWHSFGTTFATTLNLVVVAVVVVAVVVVAVVVVAVVVTSVVVV